MEREKVVLLKAVGSQRRIDILECILSGVTRPDDIAAELGVSRSSVDKQMAVLSRCNLVERTYLGDTGGRPRVKYVVTPVGRRLYESVDAVAGEYLHMLAAQYEHELGDLERALESGELSRSAYARKRRQLDRENAFVRGDW